MLTGMDHLVVVVPDLAEGLRRYTRLGFAPVLGGRHPVGSHNALLAFADGTYLELLGFYQPSPAHRWWGPLFQGGGLVDFCCATDDLPADVAALRAAGVVIDEPRPFLRHRPDGYQVRWRLAIPRAAHRGVAPFLIADETPRGERVPRDTGHPNGVVGIGTVTVAVADVGPVERWYHHALGRPGRPIAREDVDGIGVRILLGPHVLDVVAPRGPRGPVADWLAARGASPFAATLRVTSGHRQDLDPGETLGARLTLDPAPAP